LSALRGATVEEIAQVKGVTPAVALAVRDLFQSTTRAPIKAEDPFAIEDAENAEK